MKLWNNKQKNACTTQTIQQLRHGITDLHAEQDNMIAMHEKEQQQLVAIQQTIEKDNKKWWNIPQTFFWNVAVIIVLCT